MALLDFLDLGGETMAGPAASAIAPQIQSGYQQGMKDFSDAQMAMAKLQEVDRKMGMDAFEIRNKIADRPLEALSKMQKVNIPLAVPSAEHYAQAAAEIVPKDFKGKLSEEAKTLIANKAQELATAERPAMDPFHPENFLQGVSSGQTPVLSDLQADVMKQEAASRAMMSKELLKTQYAAELEARKEAARVEAQDKSLAASDERQRKALESSDLRQRKALGAAQSFLNQKEGFAASEAQKTKANRAADDAIKSFRKFSNPSANPIVAKKIHDTYKSIQSMGVRDASQRFYDTYADVLSMAGEPRPGYPQSAKQLSAAAAQVFKPKKSAGLLTSSKEDLLAREREKAGSKPPEIQIVPGMGPFQKVGSKWVRVK